MGRKSIIGQCNNSGLVNKYIGTSYDTVKFVADNMSTIQELHDNMYIYDNYLGVHDEVPTETLTGNVVKPGDYYFDTGIQSFGFITEVILAEDSVSGEIEVTVFYLDMVTIEQLAKSAEDSANAASASEVEAGNSAIEAKESADYLTNMTAEGTSLPSGSDPTASYDVNTGVLTIGIPSATLVDDLISTDTDKGLTANQGKVLKDVQDSLDVRLTDVGNDVEGLSQSVSQNWVVANQADARSLANESDISTIDTRVDALELGGGSGVDQTARDAAALAQSTATTAENKADTNTISMTALEVRITELESSGGGSGPSTPSIGELFQFAGSINEIPFEGEWHDMTDSKIFEESEYPEFVALNRDVSEDAGGVQKVSQLGNYRNEFYGYGAFKYWDDQEYFLRTTVGSQEPYGLTIVSDKFDLVGQKYTSIFTNNNYYREPGQIANTATNSIANPSKYMTPFEIRSGVTMFDGTITNRAFVYTLGSYSGGGDFTIRVFDLSSNANNLSDIDQSITNQYLNDYNTYYDLNTFGVDNKCALLDVHYFEDYFYMYTDTKGLKKYSYDFSGSTIKELTMLKNYSTSINLDVTANIRSQLTVIGNKSEDIYQIDTETGDLYVNGINTKRLIFIRPTGVDDPEWVPIQGELGNVDLTNTYCSLIINEFEDKKFVFASFVDGEDINRGVNGGAYFNGTEWSNFTIPHPSGYQYNSIAPVKVNLETGLIIANVKKSRSGSDIGDITNENIKLIISTNYGETWYEDENLINGSSTGSNEALLGYQTSVEGGHTWYVYNNNTTPYNTLIQDKNLFSRDEYFSIGLDGFLLNLRYISDVEQTTSTITSQLSQFNKINNYIRVK